MTGSDEAVFNKVRRNVLPLLIVGYIVAYIDRVNIGYAGLSMQEDIGISDAVFGLAAGIFFIGYTLFEVPSNLMLARVGARRWIPRIMISWGIVVVLMATVDSEEWFLVLRFLLGVAEAGFFPGVLFYLSNWVPEEERARLIGGFLFAMPISMIIGAPISGAILELDGTAGLAGWRWLFILEGLPAVFLGIYAIFKLVDGPEQASWLTTRERTTLLQRLEADRAKRLQRGHGSIRTALRDPRVALLSLVYFGFVAGLYALTLWLPRSLADLGLGSVANGFAAAVPFAIGSCMMLVAPRLIGFGGQTAWHSTAWGTLSCIGCGSLWFIGNELVPFLIAYTMTVIGLLCALTLFWTLPVRFLAGAAAAAGIALINSVGNFGGFVGPIAITQMKTSGASGGAELATAALFLAGATALMALYAARSSAEPQRGSGPTTPAGAE